MFLYNKSFDPCWFEHKDVSLPCHSRRIERVGATALCRDGTCRFSRIRRGTCSHHGGVKRWL
ncbi:DUF3761 domain-containing protein [uncultured Parabacteroides sp.]|uniref:DUF3761 domain-containing protein n=1 Tax=uncultured Parabacteroides sp. TaxID=512312 RepID=UPI0025FE8620|nr:DUF3761 domain-containing protein [uncultured Parabacteroides sp.]